MPEPLMKTAGGAASRAMRGRQAPRGEQPARLERRFSRFAPAFVRDPFTSQIDDGIDALQIAAPTSPALPSGFQATSSRTPGSRAAGEDADGVTIA